MTENQNPEQKARDNIDALLKQAGWAVQDNKKIDLNAGLGQAVREYQTDVGPADYVLFVDQASRSRTSPPRARRMPDSIRRPDSCGARSRADVGTQMRRQRTVTYWYPVVTDKYPIGRLLKVEITAEGGRFYLAGYSVIQFHGSKVPLFLE